MKKSYLFAQLFNVGSEKETENGGTAAAQSDANAEEEITLDEDDLEGDDIEDETEEDDLLEE